MEFIKEEKRITWNKLKFRIQKRNVLKDGINFKSILKDILEFRLFNKIDLDDILIVMIRKPFDRSRLSNLTSTLDNQRFPIRIVFPSLQIVIDLPLKQLIHI